MQHTCTQSNSILDSRIVGVHDNNSWLKVKIGLMTGRLSRFSESRTDTEVRDWKERVYGKNIAKVVLPLRERNLSDDNSANRQL